MPKRLLEQVRQESGTCVIPEKPAKQPRTKESSVRTLISPVDSTPMVPVTSPSPHDIRKDVMVTVGLEAEVLVSYEGGGTLKILKDGVILNVDDYMPRYLKEFAENHAGDYYDTLLLKTRDGLINVAIEHIDGKYTIEFATEPSDVRCSTPMPTPIILHQRLLGMLQSFQRYIDCSDKTDIDLWDWAEGYNSSISEEMQKFLLPDDLAELKAPPYLEEGAKPIIQVSPRAKLLYGFHVNATIPLELLYSVRMLELFPVQTSFPELPPASGVTKMWPSCSPDLTEHNKWTRGLIGDIETTINIFLAEQTEIGSDVQKARIAGVLRTIFYLYCMYLYTYGKGKPNFLRYKHFPAKYFLEDYLKDFFIAGLPKFPLHQLITIWCTNEERDLLRQAFCGENQTLWGHLEEILRQIIIKSFNYTSCPTTIAEGLSRYLNNFIKAPLNGATAGTGTEVEAVRWVCKTISDSIHPLLEFRAPLGNGCNANEMSSMFTWVETNLHKVGNPLQIKSGPEQIDDAATPPDLVEDPSLASTHSASAEFSLSTAPSSTIALLLPVASSALPVNARHLVEKLLNGTAASLELIPILSDEMSRDAFLDFVAAGKNPQIIGELARLTSCLTLNTRIPRFVKLVAQKLTADELLHVITASRNARAISGLASLVRCIAPSHPRLRTIRKLLLTSMSIGVVAASGNASAIGELAALGANMDGYGPRIEIMVGKLTANEPLGVVAASGNASAIGALAAVATRTLDFVRLHYIVQLLATSAPLNVVARSRDLSAIHSLVNLVKKDVWVNTHLFKAVVAEQIKTAKDDDAMQLLLSGPFATPTSPPPVHFRPTAPPTAVPVSLITYCCLQSP